MVAADMLANHGTRSILYQLCHGPPVHLYLVILADALIQSDLQ